MKEYLESYLRQIDQLGGKSKELIFENPSTEQDLANVELKLAYKIPKDFRNILLTISSHLEFNWFLPETLILPEPLKQIFCGELHWNVNSIADS